MRTDVPSVFDTVVVGSPNPTPIEYVPETACDYVWQETIDSVPVMWCCTREAHTSGQHVAEGSDETGVLAVAPWSE